MKTICFILALAVTIPLSPQAQNLILNPGCEDTLINENIPHWQEITGANWTQRKVSPEPQAGTSYFFPGVAATAELGQVIDVADDSTAIDNGIKIYYFTGYVRAYEQSPPDESNIFIHFRNGADILLTSFQFGPYTQTQTWLRIDSALSVPPGARKIDIRLHSVRHNGSNNDGYYDELYLGNSPLVKVPEVAKKQDFLIYPNPSSGLFTFEVFMHQQSMVQVVLFNSLGQEVATLANGFYPAGLLRFNPNSGNLPEGIYYLRLKAGADSAVQKLIVLHRNENR